MLFLTFVGLWVGFEGGGTYAIRALITWLVASSPMLALPASLVVGPSKRRLTLVGWATALLLLESVALIEAWGFLLAPAALASAIAAWRVLRSAGSGWIALVLGGVVSLGSGVIAATVWVLGE